MSAGYTAGMRLGLRTILLIIAVVLFLLVFILDENEFDLLAAGLACFAGSFLVDDLGLANRRFGR